jgi:DNA-binding transcriptional LysR family regulator
MRFKGLDLNHLLTLEVLLSERNLTRAAKRLHVTQPAISNALTRLREYFEDPLLERRGRDMHPSAFALTLLRPLQETLQSIERIAATRPQFDAATASREYKIVASDYVTGTVLGPLTARLQSSAPHVRLIQLPLNDDSIGKFCRGECDAMIMPESGREMLTGVSRRFLFLENFVCIAAKSNATVPDSLSIDQYFALPRVVPPHRKYWPEDFLGAKSSDGNVIPMPFSTIPLFVANSDHIAIIPSRLADLFEPVLQLRRIPLETPIPPIRFNIQTRASEQRDPFHSWMLDQICDTSQRSVLRKAG